jgi:hypothetical protein
MHFGLCLYLQTPHHRPRILAILAAASDAPQLAQLDTMSTHHGSTSCADAAPSLQVGDMQVSRMLNALLQMNLDALRSRDSEQPVPLQMIADWAATVQHLSTVVSR